MTAEPIDIADLLEERGKRYGKFTEHAMVTQRLKDSMREFTLPVTDPDLAAKGRTYQPWNTLDNDQQEALEMIAHKIGRILNGSPNYIDSWVDIAGYATLVANRLREDGSGET